MTKGKMMTAVLLGLLMTWGAATKARAADPDAASLTIRITPNVDYGVQIDTATYDSGGDGYISLGTVDLYASTWTVRPATVTILGNVGTAGANTGQELDLSAAIASAGTAWTFDATPSTDATNGAVDELAMYALFSETTLSAAPGGDDFANGTADASYASGSQRAGAANPNNGDKYEYQGGTIDMDNLSPSDQSHLWLFFRLPSTTSDTQAQDVTVTLTAVSAGT